MATELDDVMNAPADVDACQTDEEGDRGCRLADYMRRYAHLPVRRKSPLLRYTFSDLLDPNRVRDCEIDQLTQWVGDSRQLLTIARSNRTPLNVDHFQEKLIGGKSGVSSVLTFFLHTPFDEKYRGNLHYESAYEKFPEQGAKIVRKLIEHYARQSAGKVVEILLREEDFLIDINDTNFHNTVKPVLKRTV